MTVFKGSEELAKALFYMLARHLNGRYGLNLDPYQFYRDFREGRIARLRLILEDVGEG